MVPLSLLVVLLVFAPIALLIVLPLLQVLILDLVAVGEKIFKLEIGEFSNLSLLCGGDQETKHMVLMCRPWVLGFY